MTAIRTFDCQRCGACCCNVNVNRRYGLVDYIEIERRDRTLKNPALKSLTVLDGDGIPHMKLDHHQRCVALAGRLGRSVTCTIYDDRPSGCRRVEPGDAECRKARRERGIDPPSHRARN